MKKETFEKAKIIIEQLNAIEKVFKKIDGLTIDRGLIQIDCNYVHLKGESMGRLLQFLKNEKDVLERKLEEL